MVVTLFISLTLGYFAWSMITLQINYRRACSMGIPAFRVPIDFLNFGWLIFEKPVWSILNRLPIDFGTFAIYSRRGWHFKDKAKSHLEYGRRKLRQLISISLLPIQKQSKTYFSDGKISLDQFSSTVSETSKKDKHLIDKTIELLDMYGPTISTASWKEWPRYRKVLAQPFNESIMKFVWDESLVQAKDMLKSWTEGSQESTSFARDTRTLSLDVLAATGFRRSYAFRGSSQPSTNEPATYRDALQLVLDNAIFLMLVPKRILNFPVLPKSWKKLGKAASDYQQYMQDMVDQETYQMSQGKASSGSIMTSFVRALNTHKKEEQGLSKGLSIQEIFGNIFVINFAGHDTTANTLAFCMILLAAHPEVQEWVGAELQEVLKDHPLQNGGYELIFPKLKRCKAVMVSD